MKKHFFEVLILLLLAFSCVLTSCNSGHVPAESVPQSNTPFETDSESGGEEKVESPFFYSIAATAGMIERHETAEFKTGSMKHAQEAGIECDQFVTKTPDHRPAESKTIPFTMLPLNYSQTTYTYKNHEKKAYGDFYGTTDWYNGSDANRQHFTAQFHAQTGELTYYTANVKANVDAPTLSEEQLLAKAEEYILQVISPAELAEYTIDADMPKQVDYGQERGIRYHVVYRRYIHGYATDDMIMVVLHPEGTLTMYGAKEFGKYEGLATSLTKEALDAAADTLKAEGESWNAEEITFSRYPQIVINTSGEAYLRLAYYYYPVSDSNYIVEYLYLKIDV